MSSEELQSAIQATPMDFDITGTNPGVPTANTTGTGEDATVALNMDDLVFDVTATHPKIPAATASAPAAPADDGGLTFTLDFPTESMPKAVTPVRDLGLDEITLNLDKPAASGGAASPELKDEHWQEVATKLDLAKAYVEMGDKEGAREILQEVLEEGGPEQKESAQKLMAAL